MLLRHIMAGSKTYAFGGKSNNKNVLAEVLEDSLHAQHQALVDALVLLTCCHTVIYE